MSRTSGPSLPLRPGDEVTLTKAPGVWVVSSIWDTNTEGRRVNLVSAEDPSQRRSVALSDTRSARPLPPALR